MRKCIISKIKVLNVFLLFVILLIVSSCATLSESECESANWEIIGLEDGSQGRDASYIGKHRRACSDYNISPDLNAYLQGRASGLKQFCTQQNGFNRGASGQLNNNVCPFELARTFNIGYYQGVKVYKLQSEINHLIANIHAHQDRIVEIKDLNLILEEQLVSNGIRSQRRRELLREIKQLEKETINLYDDIDEMNIIIARLEKKLHKQRYQ